MSAAKEAWARRAERLEAWAVSADAKAKRIEDSRPAHYSDPAFLTQPGAIMQRERNRGAARDRAAFELRQKAEAHRAKAVSLRQMAARNKGDAEAAREEQRAALSDVVTVGSLVSSVYGIREVLKVNGKTLRLKGALADVTIDKALCKLVRSAA